MTAPRLWTLWDLPFLGGLLMLSWFLGQAALGPPGLATHLQIEAPTGSRVIPLTEGILEVQGKLGIHRLEVAHDGALRILSAPCPAQLCKTLGPVHKAGEALICVPNQVLFELRGAPLESQLDGVTR